MKKLSLNLSSLIIIILLTFSFSYSDEKNIAKGKVIVIDGDTIKINGERIRFGGIDAPETNYQGKKQPCYLNEIKVFCGKLSTDKLKEKIGNGFVYCVREKNKDRNGRTIAECFINDESLSKYMVKAGYAFDFARYSEKKYLKDEVYAKINKQGLWNMKFEYPWEWRKKIREANK